MLYDPDQKRLLVERKLADMRQRAIVPPSLMDLVTRIIEAQDAARSRQNKIDVQSSALSQAPGIGQGAPMLLRNDFPVSREVIDPLFQDLLAILGALGPDHAEACALIRAALDAGELDLDLALSQYLSGDDRLFLEWADKTPKVPRALTFLCASSLSPCIEATARDLAARLDMTTPWPFGHCPVCGSLPLIARLLEKEGARHLTCSFCHVEYRVRRLQCPYCEEASSDKLTYFEAEGEPGFQVHACASCNMYMKTVDFRNMDRPSFPLLDDMESLTLDILAQKQGLMRPTLSGWGF